MTLSSGLNLILRIISILRKGFILGRIFQRSIRHFIELVFCFVPSVKDLFTAKITKEFIHLPFSFFFFVQASRRSGSISFPINSQKIPSAGVITISFIISVLCPFFLRISRKASLYFNSCLVFS